MESDAMEHLNWYSRIVSQVNDDDLVFFCLPVTILIFEKALSQEITENKFSILQPVNALFIFHLI